MMIKTKQSVRGQETRNGGAEPLPIAAASPWGRAVGTGEVFPSIPSSAAPQYLSSISLCKHWLPLGSGSLDIHTPYR